jgi:hypothetical protein
MSTKHCYFPSLGIRQCSKGFQKNVNTTDTHIINTVYFFSGQPSTCFYLNEGCIYRMAATGHQMLRWEPPAIPMSTWLPSPWGASSFSSYLWDFFSFPAALHWPSLRLAKGRACLPRLPTEQFLWVPVVIVCCGRWYWYGWVPPSSVPYSPSTSCQGWRHWPQEMTLITPLSEQQERKCLDSAPKRKGIVVYSLVSK